MNFLYAFFVLVSALATLVTAAPVETSRAAVNAGEIAVANVELKPVSKTITSSKRSVPARFRSLAERRLSKRADAKKKGPKPKNKKSKKLDVEEANDEPEGNAGVDNASRTLPGGNGKPGEAALGNSGDHKKEKPKKKAKHTTKKKSSKKGNGGDDGDQTGSDDDPGTDNASENEHGTDRDED